MSILSPILASLANALGGALKAAAPLTIWTDDTADGGLGVVMSGLSGVAAALAVAMIASVYLRTGYRSTRDMVRHGLAAALVLTLIGFAVYDMRGTALSYLGLSPAAAKESTVGLPLTGLSGPGIKARAPALLPVPGQTI